MRERGERGVRVLDDTLHFQCRPITVHTSINPFIERALSCARTVTLTYDAIPVLSFIQIDL